MKPPRAPARLQALQSAVAFQALFTRRTCARCALKRSIELGRSVELVGSSRRELHGAPSRLVRGPDASSRRQCHSSFVHSYAQDAKQRRASTYASATAVNASKDIAPTLQELYRALERLKKDAANYVNLSRLGLALRSLESRAPVVRIAVLGLQTQRSARRLARLLLADPLSPEGAWEQQLMKFADDDSRGLLLRFGEEDDISSSTALPSTLHIPSRVLQKHNAEVLISSLNITTSAPQLGPGNADELVDSALVPTAEILGSSARGVSFITYPVHRAVVIADGLDGLLTLGKYNLDAQSESNTSHKPFQAAVNLPTTDAKLKGQDNASAVPILDLPQASAALDIFRKSNTNGRAYEKGWFESGMPALTAWLSSAPSETSAPSSPVPAVRELISSILDNTSKNILLEDEARLRELAVRRSADQFQQPLEEALWVWAMRAHEELRDSLDSAFTSAKWHRLKWWKLLWRVDDVGMITAELLERSWLVEAEKGVIWLSGRAVEAGLYEATLEPPPSTLDAERSPSKVAAKEQSAAMEAAAERDPTPAPSRSVTGNPWPSQIPTARANLGSATIPPLQALAQALLLQSASLTLLTSALSALVYAAVPETTAYSAGAVAALGAVWALRRLQKLWEAARQAWEEQVRDAARVALKATEALARRDVLKTEAKDAAGAAAAETDVGVLDRRVAREAVETARRALADVGGASASGKSR